MTIGITTRFKNRLSFLKVSLSTWVSLPVNHITIVDWDSEEDIIPLIDSFQDSRIHVLRFENQKYFKPGVCHNVAIRNTPCDYIFAIDNDVSINFNIFEKLELNSRSFITVPKNVSVYKTGIYGTCIFPKRMWLDVNGFVEGQLAWSGEDTDFYKRGVAAGYINNESLTLDMLEHQSHNDKLRFKHLPFNMVKHRREGRLFNENWIKNIDVAIQQRLLYKGRVYNNGKWSDLMFL